MVVRAVFAKVVEGLVTVEVGEEGPIQPHLGLIMKKYPLLFAQNFPNNL